MEKKYTPGEWSINILAKRNSMGIPQATIYKYPGNDKSFAKNIIANAYGKDIPEAEANAKLIVAAPKLLEALQIFMECFNKAEDEAHMDYMLQEREFLSKATEAIKKATE